MSTVLSDQEALRNIAANVRRLRRDRSRSWLARQTGTYPINITRIENAEHMPGSGLLIRLAEALGASIDDLVAPPPPEAPNRPTARGRAAPTKFF